MTRNIFVFTHCGRRAQNGLRLGAAWWGGDYCRGPSTNRGGHGDGQNEQIEGVFWWWNKQTLLMDWIFFWNLCEITRALFSGRICINSDLIDMEM